MWLIDGSGLLMCEWNWFAIKRVQMGKHWNGCHGNWQSKSINQSMNNTENVIFSRRSFVTDVNSQSANRKTLLFVCAIFINCLIYKLHCDMKRAWLSTSEFLVQSKINFNHISDRVAKLAMKWILVVLVCHCERCSVYVLCDGTARVCVFLCENVYLLLLSPEINCHLNWHAFVRMYQAVCDEYYPVGTRKHDCHTNNTNHSHLDATSAAQQQQQQWK